MARDRHRPSVTHPIRLSVLLARLGRIAGLGGLFWANSVKSRHNKIPVCLSATLFSHRSAQSQIRKPRLCSHPLHPTHTSTYSRLGILVYLVSLSLLVSVFPIHTSNTCIDRLGILPVYRIPIFFRIWGYAW